jgi:hypothetical protein
MLPTKGEDKCGRIRGKVLWEHGGRRVGAISSELSRSHVKRARQPIFDNLKNKKKTYTTPGKENECSIEEAVQLDFSLETKTRCAMAKDAG